jgi:hypothetical protein
MGSGDGIEKRMSQLNSQVVGVIDIELGDERLRAWMDEDAHATSVSPPVRSVYAVTTSTVAADVAQLSDELRSELRRLLSSMRDAR